CRPLTDVVSWNSASGVRGICLTESIRYNRPTEKEGPITMLRRQTWSAIALLLLIALLALGCGANQLISQAPTPTATPTKTPKPTFAPPAEPTAPPEATPTLEPTATTEATETPVPTDTPEVTATIEPPTATPVPPTATTAPVVAQPTQPPAPQPT